jgi:hypothetical protein
MDDARFDVNWLNGIADYRDPVPIKKMVFVRTRHIGNKREGCFICGRKSHTTRHHIRKGTDPLAVYLCRRHHDIIHGTGLHRFRTVDIRMVLCLAREYSLFKETEATIIEKRLVGELENREYDGNTSAWFGRVGYQVE